MTNSNSSISDVHNFLAAHWKQTVRTPQQQGDYEVPLPHPFTVPTIGPEFHIFFYWDTYFTSEGLLRSGDPTLVEVAKNNADNFIHLLQKLHHIPNFTIASDLNRSQPPVASLLFRAIYDRSCDKEWLQSAYDALDIEYSFWTAMRSSGNGLNHYGHHATPAQVDNFYWVVKDRLIDVPEDKSERLLYNAHSFAEAESGWDFTPRFERRCLDFNPIDLNSLLFALEDNMAYFSEELGNNEVAKWRYRAEQRRTLINQLLWNEERGFYFDYDAKNARQGNIASAAAFFPLWCGVATAEQAARVAKNLPLLERDGGIATCAPNSKDNAQVYQWDGNNAWPPLQFAAIAGLKRCGFEEDARRIAQKYVTTVANVFAQTGNLWEKYNAAEGNIEVQDEYSMPAMLGWTAATFLYACEIAQMQNSDSER